MPSLETGSKLGHRGDGDEAKETDPQDPRDGSYQSPATSSVSSSATTNGCTEAGAQKQVIRDPLN
jgi:hypothetical protein